MREHLGDRGLVVAFLCNHCPYVKSLADRLAEDAKTLLEEGIQVVGVMSNDYESYPDDSPDNMAKFAEAHHFPFPYLVDEDQSVARMFGAVCTPDFFGLDREGTLQYRGRLDNLRYGVSPATPRVPDLVLAMRTIGGTGHGPTEQAPSLGCSIKWRGEDC